VLQIVFGLFRAGILGEYFPLSAVHGMLAAIGVIIILKQFPVALGVVAKGEPLELLKQIPQFIREANPAIATIGGISMLIMFLWPVVNKRLGPLRKIPAPMIVLLVAVPLGMAFDLLHDHSYMLQGHKYQLGQQYMVTMPNRVFGMFDEIRYPDLTALQAAKAWKWVMMFFLIGTLESLLEMEVVRLGASGFTTIPCTGARLHEIRTGGSSSVPHVRIEVIAPSDVCQAILEYLRREVRAHHDVTTCVETVEVLRLADFVGAGGAESGARQPQTVGH
jgi:hypothetical protein